MYNNNALICINLIMEEHVKFVRSEFSTKLFI